MAIGLYSPLAGIEFNEGLSDPDAPFLADQVPASGSFDILVDSDVNFSVNDLDAGVVLSSVVVQIHSGTGFFTIFSGSTFQNGVTGSVSLFGTSSYDFNIDPDVDFPSSQFIQIRVLADDFDLNSMDSTYGFTTESIVPIEPVEFLQRIYPHRRRTPHLNADGEDDQLYRRPRPLVTRRRR